MRRVIIAGMIGNGLEWYDFALYGYFASTIGKLFFPVQDPYTQLIATYGIFAFGFLMRPIGGMLFGYLGDKFGRKFALTLSMLMMAVPTALIGVLPTYSMIGIAAPVLLALVRMLQGLALAGQFTGSITFIVEHAPIGRRGFAGSTTIMSLCAGMLLGSAVATIIAESLSQTSLEAWGWRIPFLLGGVIAIVGFYIRRYTQESPHYEKAKTEGTLSKAPIRETLTQHFGKVVRGVGIYLSVTVPFYTLTVFLNGFLSGVLGHPVRDALLISTLSMILLMVLVIPTAMLSDKYGRKKMLMAVCIAYFIFSYPLFCLITAPGFTSAFIGEMLLSVIVAFYIGTAPTVYVELFPTSVRYTGVALSYNICAALFGGTAPMVSTWLVKQSGGMNTIPAFYLMLCAVLSFMAFIGYHDRYKEELES